MYRHWFNRQTYISIFNSQKLLQCIRLAIAPAIIFYIIALFVLSIAGFSFVEILRDPAQHTGQSSFLGFMSNIGAWVWVAAAAISLFGAFNSTLVQEDTFRHLLFLTGLLSLLLVTDDFFMIHDRYVNERICFLFYAVVLLTILLKFTTHIVASDPLSFLLAGSMLAMSILIDLLQPRLPIAYEHVQVVEEAFKFAGAATWLFFCCHLARQAIATNAPSQVINT